MEENMATLIVLSALFAVTDWFAVLTRRRRLELAAKPLTLLFLIGWYATSLPQSAPAFALWFMVGLLFSLAGDVFLLFSATQFLKGLVAFLLAHLMYIAVFNAGGWLFSLPGMLIALGIAGIAVLIMRPIVQSMRADGRSGMIAPVSLYAVVLGATLWSTWVTLLKPDWSALAAGLVAVGGTLFFVSDTALAWNRFVRPGSGNRALEMITYHLAQFSLTVGVLVAIGSLG
jgi:uncharacterized membrane protein YhhN